jgi:Ricin-type beta-trefoil lectin domain/Glycosyl hydrolase family 76/Ricin-type beta-trefoil lectin domain-like
MKRRTRATAWYAALALACAGVVVAPTTASADPLPSADVAFQAWNNAFLVQGGATGTYYTDELKSIGTQRAGTWIGALDIQLAQDQYERTRSASDWQLVDNLVSTFIADEGTDWTASDTWNDDIAWMDTAVLRGYIDTGNASWLTTAENQWNAAYDRGWSSAGGGGIWEEMNSMYSKCALSNDPMISLAVELYEITGTGSYLTDAEQIYSWVRSNLVNTSTGVVNECIAFPNGPNGTTELQASDNAYNGGSFIEAADNLYRVTGNSEYHDDAQRTADHFLDTVPIVANTSEAGSSYQYWLFKGISDFCTDTDTCATYDSYMLSNATRAWDERNSADLTWNDWNSPTTDSNPDAFEMIGMVGLLEDLPTATPSPFSGQYEIKNVTSGLSLGAQNDSTASAAPIVQNTDSGDASASWSFVPESNGYYEIVNERSGQLLNISAASGAPGASAVQWPAGGLVPGNDQWMPVRNPDGSYSFYNRNSQFALDDTAGSTAAGTGYEQWPPTNGSNQEFDLISRSSGAAPTTGTSAVSSGVSGLCLDDAGGAATAGNKIDVYGCNNTAAQQWTPANGTLMNNGMCLDVVGPYSTADGTLVDLWTCNGGANQVWEPQADGELLNPQSGKCLDDPAASTTPGTQVEIWDCNDGANQQWTLPPLIGPAVSGIDGLCLDDNADSTADGNKIDIYGCNDTGAQQWQLTGGTLRDNGKCLDVAGGGSADGTLVDLYTCNGTGAQTWQPQADGELLNPQSGKCLDDPAASATPGTQVEIWDCNDGANQQWTLPSA